MLCESLQLWLDQDILRCIVTRLDFCKIIIWENGPRLILKWSNTNVFLSNNIVCRFFSISKTIYEILGIIILILRTLSNVPLQRYSTALRIQVVDSL